MAQQPFLYLQNGGIVKGDHTQFDYTEDFLGYTKNKTAEFIPVHAYGEHSNYLFTVQKPLTDTKTVKKDVKKPGENVIIRDKTGRKFVILKQTKLVSNSTDNVFLPCEESQHFTRSSKNNEHDAEFTSDATALLNLPQTMEKIRTLMDTTDDPLKTPCKQRTSLTVHRFHLETILYALDIYKKIKKSDENKIKQLRSENGSIVRQSTNLATEFLSTKKAMRELRTELKQVQSERDNVNAELHKIRNDLRMVSEDNNKYVAQLCLNRNKIANLNNLLDRNAMKLIELNDALLSKNELTHEQVDSINAAENVAIKESNDLVENNSVDINAELDDFESILQTHVIREPIEETKANKLVVKKPCYKLVTPKLKPILPKLTKDPLHGLKKIIIPTARQAINPVLPKLTKITPKLYYLKSVHGANGIQVQTGERKLATFIKPPAKKLIDEGPPLPPLALSRPDDLGNDILQFVNNYEVIDPAIIGTDANLGVQLVVPKINMLSTHAYKPPEEPLVSWKQQLLFHFQICDKEDVIGNLPIHNAVLANDDIAVQKQLAVLKYKNISLDVENACGYSSLQLAVMHKASPKIIAILIEKGADCAKIDNEGNNIFHLTVTHCNTDLLPILTTVDINKHIGAINAYNFDGATPLIICAIQKQDQDAGILIRLGADLNLRDGKSGRTALFHAVSANSVETVKLLLKKGADKTIRSFVGNSVQEAILEIETTHPAIKALICVSDDKIKSRDHNVLKTRHRNQLTVVSKKVKINP